MHTLRMYREMLERQQTLCIDGCKMHLNKYEMYLRMAWNIVHVVHVTLYIISWAQGPPLLLLGRRPTRVAHLSCLIHFNRYYSPTHR